MEKNAYEAKKTEKPIWDNDEAEVSLKAINKNVEIPEDLICPVCKDLLKVSKHNRFYVPYMHMIIVNICPELSFNYFTGCHYDAHMCMPDVR